MQSIVCNAPIWQPATHRQPLQHVGNSWGAIHRHCPKPAAHRSHAVTGCNLTPQPGPQVTVDACRVYPSSLHHLNAIIRNTIGCTTSHAIDSLQRGSTVAVLLHCWPRQVFRLRQPRVQQYGSAPYGSPSPPDRHHRSPPRTTALCTPPCAHHPVGTCAAHQHTHTRTLIG